MVKRQKGKGVKEIMKFIKDKKIISRGLGWINHPIAQKASQVAGFLGYGHRKRKMKGGSAFTDFFTKTIPSTFSKPSNILSGLALIPSPLSAPLGVAGGIAKLTGHGRRRKNVIMI